MRLTVTAGSGSDSYTGLQMLRLQFGGGAASSLSSSCQTNHSLTRAQTDQHKTYRVAQSGFSDLEVVELEGFGVVGVEVVPNKDGCSHQNDQQQNSNSHPSFVCHMYLQIQREPRSEVK